MKYYRLRLEAPAHKVGVTVDPNRKEIATSVELEFEFPLRSEFITSVGAYVVTSELADALQDAEFTGFNFGPVTKASIASWSECKDQITIPPLKCLVPIGVPLVDDFGVANRHLIVSERAARWLIDRDPALRRRTNEVGPDAKPIGLHNPISVAESDT